MTETALRHLKADLGLRAPTPGSLGWTFALVLCAGVPVAWVLGVLVHERGGVTLLMLMSLLVWQPMVEELLFRGILQGLLLSTTLGSASRWGVSVANLATSLAFVIVHFVNQPAAWAIGVFIPSLLFGLFRDRSNSIWPAVALHVLFNGAFFASLAVSI